MNSFETPGLPEQNPEKKVFQEKLEELLKSGASLLEIAQILGAEKYVTQEGKKGEGGLHFDVRSFVEDQFKQETALELPMKFLKLKDTILPPGEGEIATGSGKGIEAKSSIPRTSEFIALLTELQEPYFLISGTNTDNMMRGDTYRIFLLPNREKLVFINDEEGNATFVVHSATEGSWRQYAAMTKDQLKELSPGEVQTIIYPGSLEEWRIQVETSLSITPEKNEELRMGYEKAPEGWMTRGGVERELNKSWLIIKKIAESYRKENPEWFQKYSGKGGNVYEHYHPDLVVKIKEELAKRPEEAPEGWMTNGGLAEELGVAFNTVSKIANSFRKDHPEWFNEYLHKMGTASEHYHPDLVVKIKEELAKRPEEAPDGWLTSRGLAEEVGSTRESTEKIANSLRENHPEWFSIFLDKAGRSTEHHHPALVAAIKEELSQRPEEAPEGWITNRSLAEQLNEDRGILTRIANSLRENHPEWFREYLNSQGRIFEHYHPDLVVKIKEELAKRPEEAPEGWMTTRGLAEELGVAFKSVARRVDSLRENHPEWFKDYQKRGQIFEHFHPDLINKIKEELATRPEKAPEGWITNGVLVDDLKTHSQTVSKAAERYRDSHPEWFKRYMHSRGRIFEYYHPDLVSKIKKELEKR